MENYNQRERLVYLKPLMFIQQYLLYVPKEISKCYLDSIFESLNLSILVDITILRRPIRVVPCTTLQGG